MVRTFDELGELQSSDEFRRVIKQVQSEVMAGHTLSRALSQHPDVFDERYLVSVRYGEMYGILDETLQRLVNSSSVGDFN